MSFPERQHFGEGWTHKNRQPGRTPQEGWITLRNIPECPHYTLLEICASLAGVLPNDLYQKDKFCGQEGKYEDSIGVLSGFRGIEKRPLATCSEVYRQLGTMIDFMRKEVMCDVEAITTVLQSTEDIRSKKEALDKHVQDLDQLKEQRQILFNWQQVIFEICCIPNIKNIKADQLSLPEPDWTPGQKFYPVAAMEPERHDPHFKRIVSPADLSYEEVLSRVEAFYLALKNQVTGNNRENFYNGRYQKGALYCPQAPVREEIGTYS